MKKLLCLLCCLCLILCSCGSDTEPPAEEPVVEKQLGIFYTENGITQNTLVNIIFPEQTMEAPLRELTYQIQNDSDYKVYVLNTYTYFQRFEQEGYCIEVYQDSKWTEPPNSGKNVSREDWEAEFLCDAHFTSGVIPMHFVDPQAEYYRGYKELPAGLYRLRIPCIFQDPPADAAITEFELVAYFTVEPAAQ